MTSKSNRLLLKPKPKEPERCYYHVDIKKLGQAFEAQFFVAFDQTQQTKLNGTVQVYQADNVTVTKGRAQYDGLKLDTQKSVAAYLKWSNVWLGVFVLTLVIVISDLVYLYKQKAPLMIQLAAKLSGQTAGREQRSSWLTVTTIAFAITAFVPFILGRFLASSTKVNSCRLITKYLSLNVLFVAAITIAATIITSLCLGSSDAYALLAGIVINLVWAASTIAVSVITMRSS